MVPSAGSTPRTTRSSAPAAPACPRAEVGVDQQWRVRGGQRQQPAHLVCRVEGRLGGLRVSGQVVDEQHVRVAAVSVLTPAEPAHPDHGDPGRKPARRWTAPCGPRLERPGERCSGSVGQRRADRLGVDPAEQVGQPIRSSSCRRSPRAAGAAAPRVVTAYRGDDSCRMRPGTGRSAPRRWSASAPTRALVASARRCTGWWPAPVPAVRRSPLVAQQPEVPRRGAQRLADLAEGEQPRVRVRRVGDQPSITGSRPAGSRRGGSPRVSASMWRSGPRVEVAQCFQSLRAASVVSRASPSHPGHRGQQLEEELLVQPRTSRAVRGALSSNSATGSRR